jgi:hypothetical protein
VMKDTNLEVPRYAMYESFLHINIHKLSANVTSRTVY